MDDQAAAIGARVRYWRQRRKLDRKHFADLVGRSTSWLDKVEKGERNLLRLPMLERVAEVLGIEPAVLLEASVAQQAAGCVDAQEVRAIRKALGSYPNLGNHPSARIDLPKLTRQAEYLDLAWASSRFTVVAQNLPSLIRDTQAAARDTTTGVLEAHRVLVTAYRLASSMLLKFEANHIAWLAADRAMHTALTTEDTWSLARATRSVARAMTSSGQKPEAIAALLGMAERMRPELGHDEENLLALYGMLFLAASVTAAKQEDVDLARQMHEEATAVARRLRPGCQTHNTFFGPTNVAIHRIAVLVRLHENRQALDLADTINPAALALLPPERRANHFLDLTAAYASVGNFRHAVHTLAKAEQTAPEEVRCRPVSHNLLRTVLHHVTGETARITQQIAQRAGVTA